MLKKANFSKEDQELAELARVLSHPARIAILRFLATTVSCMSGDISEEIPLSRTTVSQHLQELKRAGLIIGEIEGVKVNYCLNPEKIIHTHKKLDQLFELFRNGLNCC